VIAAPALFEPVGDAFVPTELTRGGWSDDAQHGGPPSALLARAIERVDTLAPMQVVRMTIDLMREVPLTPLTVRTRVVREGRRIQLVEAELAARDVVVARTSALKIRTADVPLPPDDGDDDPPPPPEECPPFAWTELDPGTSDLPRYYLNAIAIRSHRGSFGRPGPGTSWFRLLQPVVAGEETSDLVRAAAIADMGNGNSQRLDGRHWLYVNPDITLYLHAPPSSEWIGMRSRAKQHRTGLGLAATELFDEHGPIGLVAQAQLIEPR
jgi:hypothetical protein